MALCTRLLLPGRQLVQPTAEIAHDEVSTVSTQFERGVSWMRFPARLEKQFLHDSAARRLRYFLISGLLSLVVFNGFLLGDYLMVPDVFWLAVKVRLLCFTPLALVFLLFFWLRRDWVLRRLSPLVLEYVILLSGALAAASLSYILVASQAPNSQYYHVGLMMVIIYGNLVQRLRFWNAVVFSLSVLAMHIGGILMVHIFNPRLIVPMVALVGATAVFTLMTNYALERDERRQYLLSLRRKHLLGDLGLVQQRLQQLSRMDALTGLPNRRHFQQYLQQAWQRASHDQTPMSILMLDVDHFKRYNDLYGHPAGDLCLQRVAQAMQDSLRRPDDLVARYGGEEFIAVLPHADAEVARLAAERVRQAVAGLCIPHEASPTAAVVTLSVGVATVQAGQHGLTAADLIAQADAALYQAKTAGRNQVVALKA